MGKSTSTTGLALNGLLGKGADVFAEIGSLS